MAGSIVLAGALIFVFGTLLVLHSFAGKIVDQLVNSLPPRAQFFLLVLAVAVLAILWILFGR